MVRKTRRIGKDFYHVGGSLVTIAWHTDGSHQSRIFQKLFGHGSPEFSIWKCPCKPIELLEIAGKGMLKLCRHLDLEENLFWGEVRFHGNSFLDRSLFSFENPDEVSCRCSKSRWAMAHINSIHTSLWVHSGWRPSGARRMVMDSNYYASCRDQLVVRRR